MVYSMGFHFCERIFKTLHLCTGTYIKLLYQYGLVFRYKIIWYNILHKKQEGLTMIVKLTVCYINSGNF